MQSILYYTVCVDGVSLYLGVCVKSSCALLLPMNAKIDCAAPAEMIGNVRAPDAELVQLSAEGGNWRGR